MFEIFSGLSVAIVLLLLLSLLLVLVFEFINGFHDTANAVATVIYTHSMKPIHAVSASGICNFAGVALGGLAVAYAIVYLLPIDILISGDSSRVLAMIFALLIAAILWNLGTWYLGLPASSSHTLIGAILGVGLVNAILSDQDLSQGINWSKAIDVGMSLLLSPMVGFVMAGALFLLIKRFLPEANIHKSPYLRNDVEGRKHPPFWTRFLLIISALGVSFAHGSNDGQKGVGLIMLALICVVPSQFVLNLNTSRHQIEQSIDAANRLNNFISSHQAIFNQTFPPEASSETHCQVSETQQHITQLTQSLKGVTNFNDIDPAQRKAIRGHFLCIDDAAKKIVKMPELTKQDQAYVMSLRKDMSSSTEYAPMWVIFAVASALGLGTMVGWRRVVKTVGEGIGKKDMTYAQGVSAQITAAISIGMANVLGLPVSTTQVLSSGVAGTMVANRSGLQWVTVRNIGLAWVFTFPVAMLLSGGLFFIFTLFLA